MSRINFIYLEDLRKNNELPQPVDLKQLGLSNLADTELDLTIVDEFNKDAPISVPIPIDVEIKEPPAQNQQLEQISNATRSQSCF